MSHRTFVLPDELGAIINEFSKPVTRPSWKTSVTPSALALHTNFVYIQYHHDISNGTFKDTFWWWCKHILLIYSNGSRR